MCCPHPWQLGGHGVTPTFLRKFIPASLASLHRVSDLALQGLWHLGPHSSSSRAGLGTPRVAASRTPEGTWAGPPQSPRHQALGWNRAMVYLSLMERKTLSLRARHQAEVPPLQLAAGLSHHLQVGGDAWRRGCAPCSWEVQQQVVGMGPLGELSPARPVFLLYATPRPLLQASGPRSTTCRSAYHSRQPAKGGPVLGGVAAGRLGTGPTTSRHSS